MQLIFGLLLSAPTALAFDEPRIYIREMVAAAGQPGGLISDTIVEAQTPVLRFGGAVFNDTFVGGGARFAVSPAFTEASVRVSLAPIDVFDVTFEGVRSIYFNNSFGMMPFSDISNTRGDFRQERFDLGEGFSNTAWSFLAYPTGKMKVGPVVGLSAWTLTWIDINQPAGVTDPWVFESFRGMVVGWNDFLVEHTQAVLVQLEPGANLIRFGGVYRSKKSKVSPDHTITAGGLFQYDPGGAASLPSATLLVTPYLKDPDYAKEPIPFVAVVLVWEGGISLNKDVAALPDA